MSSFDEISRTKQVKTPECVEFMAREWVDDDRNNKYTIYAFGCTAKGESVCLEIKGFTPYFYLQVPDNFKDVRGLKSDLMNSLEYKHLDGCLKSISFHKKKVADGFTNDREFTFLRFVFTNSKASKQSQYILQRKYGKATGFRLFETKGVPMIVMTHIRDILMSGWIRADKLKSSSVSRCQICATTNWKNVYPMERLELPPFKTLSYDIECFSIDNTFPYPDETSDPEPIEGKDYTGNYITQIGNTIFNEKTKEYYRHIFVVGECDEIENATLVVCRNESDLIRGWVDFVKDTDPDQIVGYNIDSFDWQYIWKRAKMLGLCEYVSELSRLKHVPSEFSEKSMESNAFGFNKYDTITTPGVGQIDLLHWFRKNKKLSSYSLDAVAELYLGEHKHSVEVNQIFKWSGPEGSSSERSVVAAYCVQDTNLPVRLMQKFDVLINLIEMSKVARVPLSWLITRGESIKVYSQISYTARKLAYLIPAPPQYKAKKKFKGATVLDPKYGAYNVPVCGMDFASLYPSIMIAWNLDITTFVKDRQYLNIPGVDYETFTWDGGNVTFVQNRPGLISGILRELWALRKVKKKLMAECFARGDYEMAKIYNGAQLALKLCMNSIYGDVGSDTSALSCKEISACVTFNGRKMIDHSKKCAQTWYNGAKNGYSDSLPGDENVYVKDTKGNEKRIKIKNLGKNFTVFTQNGQTDQDKLQGESIYKIKTKDGWADVDRVLKHKTSKRLFKITTETGTVTVTEDHPMMLVGSDITFPARECKVGDVLCSA